MVCRLNTDCGSLNRNKYELQIMYKERNKNTFSNFAFSVIETFGLKKYLNQQ